MGSTLQIIPAGNMPLYAKVYITLFTFLLSKVIWCPASVFWKIWFISFILFLHILCIMNNVVVVVAQILSSYNSDAHLNWLGTMHVFPFNSDCLNLQKSAFGYILILVCLFRNTKRMERLWSATCSPRSITAKQTSIFIHMWTISWQNYFTRIVVSFVI